MEFQADQPRTRFQLAIVLPATNQIIGKCGLRRETPESPEAEINYALAVDTWGQGYATEAAGDLLTFGFTDLSLHRMSVLVAAENTASARVLEKLGMHLEGRLREKEFYKDRWWDVLVYGILRQGL